MILNLLISAVKGPSNIVFPAKAFPVRTILMKIRFGVAQNQTANIEPITS